jgi:hypothetical protein
MYVWKCLSCFCNVLFFCKLCRVCLFEGRAGLKSLASVGIGVIVGLLVNKFSTYSPVIQGIIAGSVSTFNFFVHLRRLWRFTASAFYTFRIFLFYFGSRIYNWLSRICRNQVPTNPTNDIASNRRF